MHLIPKQQRRVRGQQYNCLHSRFLFLPNVIKDLKAVKTSKSYTKFQGTCHFTYWVAFIVCHKQELEQNAKSFLNKALSWSIAFEIAKSLTHRCPVILISGIICYLFKKYLSSTYCMHVSTRHTKMKKTDHNLKN